MTVLTTACRVSYSGNDVTDEFPVPFKFLDSSHLTVTETTGATVTTLAEGVDYTVDGEGEASGTVTTTDPVATGTTLGIRRNTPRTQEVDLRPEGPYLADDIEEMFDKLTLIAQEDAADIEDLQALNGTVEVDDLGNAQDIGDSFTTGDIVADSFPLVVAVPGGSDAVASSEWRIDKDGEGTTPFAEPPQVQWIPGPGANEITIIAISGLEPNATYNYRAYIFGTP